MRIVTEISSVAAGAAFALQSRAHLPRAELQRSGTLGFHRSGLQRRSETHRPALLPPPPSPRAPAAAAAAAAAAEIAAAAAAAARSLRRHPSSSYADSAAPKYVARRQHADARRRRDRTNHDFGVEQYYHRDCTCVPLFSYAIRLVFVCFSSIGRTAPLHANNNPTWHG